MGNVLRADLYRGRKAFIGIVVVVDCQGNPLQIVHAARPDRYTRNRFRHCEELLGNMFVRLGQQSNFGINSKFRLVLLDHRPQIPPIVLWPRIAIGADFRLLSIGRLDISHKDQLLCAR